MVIYLTCWRVAYKMAKIKSLYSKYHYYTYLIRVQLFEYTKHKISQIIFYSELKIIFLILI